MEQLSDSSPSEGSSSTPDRSGSGLGGESAGPAAALPVEPEPSTPDSQTADAELAEPILLRFATDLDLDGNPAQQWLVASARRVLVVALPETAAAGANVHDSFDPQASCDLGAWSGVGQVLAERTLDSVSQIRTWAGTGSGVLQFRVDGVWKPVLRFSNALADPFHHVSRGLERIRKADPPVTEEIHVDSPRRCPDCGLRLGHGTDSCPRCLHRSKIAARVWELLRPQMPGTLLLCGLTILGVAAELVPPKLQQYMVDHILVDHAPGTDSTSFVTALLVVVLALATSRVVLSVVAWFKGRLATRIGSALTHQLRARMVERLQQLAIAYYDRHQVGSLMSRVAYDSEVLQGLLHQLTGGFLLQIVQLIGVGAMLVWLNPKLAFYTLIPVPLVILGTVFFWRYVYPRYYRLWDSSSKQIAALSGMLSGIRVVKAFAQEQREFDRYNQASTYLRDSRLWVDHATSAYSATMQVVFSLGGLIVWFVGGRDVIFRDMSLGELIAFLAYLAMFYAPLATLSNFTTWLTSFLTGSKRVLELLDTPIAIAETETARPWTDVRGEICFENVTFGYDRHQPVIHNVSFRVAPGEMVGIVGRSGSGKTTMINLLGRFYDVQEGRITVDGTDIRDLTMQSLRQNIGIVFQDSFLFRGTIWENLTYGKSDCGIRAGLQAAKAAGAHDFICRNGLAYETALGEGGAGLSGGEKQRLSIARTLLYDPRVLVLDEATSNIDAEAEKSIQQALEVLIKGRTTIAIAHRLSTLRNADRIIVFDRGRLIEQGSHAELLELDGTYARLVKLQTQISRNPSVDRLVSAATPSDSTGDAVAVENAVDSTTDESAAAGSIGDNGKADGIAPAKPHDPGSFLTWMKPEDWIFEADPDGNLSVEDRSNTATGVPDSPASEKGLPIRWHGLFAVSCFPATQPGRYISIRTWNDKDEEIELGMIEDLAGFEVRQQALVMQSLARKYRLPVLTSIRSIRHVGGYLDFDVITDRGPFQFTMRWSQSQAVDFGPSGKLLIDTDDNRYVVPGLEQLSEAERFRFQQFIYW